ncbi:FecR family protein [Salegentibacter agarivorans]|uniref:FecR family protein n=1 Tax=Salegentibacter agarivorans TaxID=345907 RepID=A0A1I2NI20_9FLAO|nr:FecR domain-containing protein [Salegentibacter agarivorans]SFG03615.1 FecR family protein [Salegentibacter agarivorans]
MKERLFKKLLEKYEKGNATSREKRAVELFLTSLQETGGSPSEREYEHQLKYRILKNIKKKGTQRTRQIYQAIAVAAALLLMLGSYAYISNFPSPELTEYSEIITRKGEQKSIILSDSSQVILNADSRIIFPKKFSQEERAIKLEGEAYFSVTHEKNRPFVISSGNFVTQVLGTRFTVRNYPEETSEVVVLSGKVRVSDKINQSQIITKNQRIRLVNNKILLDQVNSEMVTSWLQKKVHFEESTPAELARILNRRYDIKVLIDESRAGLPPLSGNFSGESIWDVLESLEFIFGIENRKINRDTIELFKNK